MLLELPYSNILELLLNPIEHQKRLTTASFTADDELDIALWKSRSNEAMKFGQHSRSFPPVGLVPTHYRKS